MSSTASRVPVKICGVTRSEDVDVCALAGATWIGLNLWPGSKRYLSVEAARTLAERAHAAARPPSHPPMAVVVLVVDAGVQQAAEMVVAVGADVIQLHGDESPEACAALRSLLPRGVQLWKALSLAGPEDAAADALSRWPVDALLLDAPSPGRGGSGVPIDLLLAKAAIANARVPVVLAGGLRAQTVGDAIAACRPWAVDVASGVELRPGIKDADQVAAFVAQAFVLA